MKKTVLIIFIISSFICYSQKEKKDFEKGLEKGRLEKKKIAIELFRTHKKLHSKGEPYRFGG